MFHLSEGIQPRLHVSLSMGGDYQYGIKPHSERIIHDLFVQIFVYLISLGIPTLAVQPAHVYNLHGDTEDLICLG